MEKNRLARLVLLWFACFAVSLPFGGAAWAAPTATVKPAGSEAPAPEQTVSLELKGTDIRDALDALAKLTETNIIADQSVQGKITVTLNGVPFQQALDLIIKANGFSYRWVGNILIVAKSDRLEEALEAPAVQAFPLRYANPAAMAKALGLLIPPESIIVDDRTRALIVKGSPGRLASAKQLLAMLDVEERPVTRVFALKGAATEGLKLAVQAAVPDGEMKVGPGGRSVIVTAAPSQLAEVERLVANLDKEDTAVEVFPLRHLTPDEVRATVEAAVPGGSVTTAPGGKGLIVKGTPAQLAQASRIITGMDQAATPLAVQAQVAPELMQAKTYELKYAATDDVKAALGLVVPAASVQVGKKDRLVVVKGGEETIKKADQLVASLDKPVRQVVIETRVEEISASGSRRLGLDWTFPLTLVKDPLDVMTVTKVVSDFAATLQALEEQGDATVLASPRIVALDGKEAIIHIGDRIPIVIERKSSEGGVVYTTQEVQFIQAGILLKVTPRFNEDATLTLAVNPEVSTITGQTAQGYPSIRTRSASTTMVVKSGETVALGGLLSQNEVDTIRKTPILGDIPLFGRLFQVKEKNKRQTEIVIFLTPRVAVPATTTK
jgi:type II secretory pathway component GspD/PulD (secretin)